MAEPHVMCKGRFAPSPTGRMHAGNIFASLVSWIVAKRRGGSVVLRIEDLDVSRCRPQFADMIMHDYEFLGLTWDEGPYYQSQRGDLYAQAFEEISRTGQTYPCFCTRADVHANSAPHPGETSVYAGTCRNLSDEERRAQFDRCAQEGRAPSVRLAVPHRDIRFVDELQGECIFNLAVDCGDFIVRRSDRSWAYQLAVVVDDADMGITSVVRGADLLQSTASQTFLAELLGKEAPSYCHVPVLLGSDGKRIAKRHSHASIEELIASHKTPEAILGAIAHATGITSDNRPQAASELLESANLDALYGKREILVGDALST